MENKSKLTLYVIDLSQPSRAVMLFWALNGIEYEKRHLDIAKRELRSKEFAKINPNKQVPVMTDGEFKLFESHTIMKYLFHTRQWADHWYPVDIYQVSLLIAVFTTFSLEIDCWSILGLASYSLENRRRTSNL